jgi:starch phosphorylase
MLNPELSLKIPQRIGRIDELAHNVWWSWHPDARDLFRALNYPIWTSSGHNPVKLLADISPAELQSAAEDKAFLVSYDSVITNFDADIKTTNKWFSTEFPGSLKGPVAYFSMEFALHNSLPIYAGGLGILAGDLCKEASDLGLPLVGVGFMYPQGYFHQHVSSEGWQQEVYQQLEFDEAPITPILSEANQRCIAQVNLSNRCISIGVWLVKVGRVNIYLLDTNLEENIPEDRQLTARLYTADPEIRIQQEIVLGIGGVKVLRELGISPSVWHANEGHSAFMTLEKIRREIVSGSSFEIALQTVRASTVFTTHTPVASGHDAFNYDLVDKYFYSYWPLLEIGREEFLKLGKSDSRSPANFNMTALAINTSKQLNAVSRLHETETKKMWNGIWQGVPLEQVPISHITNGVHVPTWISIEFVKLFEKYLGKNWLNLQDDAELWEKVLDIPDKEIWSLRISLKRRLIEIITERAQNIWARGEVTPQQAIIGGALLNPQILTIAFARRFAEYKRPTLILQDVDRLKKIINNPTHPVQIIFSGKSHPADFSGKYLLHKVYTIAQDREFQGRIAFVEDYDMHMGRYLTHGVDAWLNVPQRLKEASGTSGMKAGINGVPNISVRDGWWEEGFNGKNGWEIGSGPEAASWPDQDKNDADALYTLLDEKIAPLYYQQSRSGIPHGWLKMVKESICSVMPQFCASRMLKEYTRKFYIPVAQSNQPDSTRVENNKNQ